MRKIIAGLFNLHTADEVRRQYVSGRDEGRAAAERNADGVLRLKDTEIHQKDERIRELESKKAETVAHDAVLVDPTIKIPVRDDNYTPLTQAQIDAKNAEPGRKIPYAPRPNARRKGIATGPRIASKRAVADKVIAYMACGEKENFRKQTQMHAAVMTILREGGMTLSQVCEMTGFSQPVVSKYSSVCSKADKK